MPKHIPQEEAYFAQLFNLNMLTVDTESQVSLTMVFLHWSGQAVSYCHLQTAFVGFTVFIGSSRIHLTSQHEACVTSVIVTYKRRMLLDLIAL